LALSLGITFYQIESSRKILGFERRGILLIVGILFLLIGLIGAGLPPIYAIIISTAIYVGIKIFVGRRKKMIAESVGEGLCLKCGEKVVDKKCPNCDAKT
tara:strand:- start:412 stop:711 length:300 start_codon:yes stop_codon:yes gene_type:complete